MMDLLGLEACHVQTFSNIHSIKQRLKRNKFRQFETARLEGDGGKTFGQNCEILGWKQ